ncbi:hypothetical protein T07_10722 [Trichinella nelsoni]|uniref:Uncharacterized protein n=1 Tax=Trichinella nelsoni TaxID=6336 RepID=A0A0V0RPF2_9BILA|nr:hypothetical protein T07_10722 [Trichinella nelsoni]
MQSPILCTTFFEIDPEVFLVFFVFLFKFFPFDHFGVPEVENFTSLIFRSGQSERVREKSNVGENQSASINQQRFARHSRSRILEKKTSNNIVDYVQ